MPDESKLVVVDASVVLKWQLTDEENIVQATALRDDYYYRQVLIAIAPSLLVYEVTNGISTATRRKRITPDKAVLALTNLLELGIELKEVEPLRILGLALRYNIAVYDAAYLALAERENCPLWTGDRPFYQAVKSSLLQVKWIGDYTSEKDVQIEK
jgi:predicted nucleic acid-binding protein